MHFRNLTQQRGAAGACKAGGHTVDRLTRTLGKRHAMFFSEFGHAAYKLRACKDGSGPDGNVALRFRPLIQTDRAARFQKGVPDQALVSELVRKRGLALGSFLEEILQCAGVPPCQQTVQTPDSLIKTVVRFRTDRDDGEFPVHHAPDLRGDPNDHPVILNHFGVFDADFRKSARNRFVCNKYAGNDQRTEKVPLPAFIQSGMRHKRRRRCPDFPRLPEGFLTENFRFEYEFNKILRIRTLHNKFPALVSGDGNLSGRCLEHHIGSLRKAPVAFQQNLPERKHLRTEKFENEIFPGLSDVPLHPFSSRNGLFHSFFPSSGFDKAYLAI